MATRDELTLEVTEYETNPPTHGDWLRLTARVTADGFQGVTDFWLSRVDFEAFAAELDALDLTLAGRADLIGGVGTDEHIRLALLPEGRSGRIRVAVTLATFGDPGEVVSRVEAALIVLPNDLSAFRRAVQGLLDTRSLGEARIALADAPAS